MTPYLLTVPYVGFKPSTEQKLAGHLTEPPVSVPRARVVIPAETAAALPPEEPPGTLSRFQGFFVGPKALAWVVLPIANSSMLVLPTTIPSSASILRITVAS